MSRRRLLLLAFTVFAVAAPLVLLGIAAVAEQVPAPRSAAALAALVAGLVVYAVLVWRALRIFRLTRRRVDLLAAAGLVWLAPAFAALLLADLDELGWWLGGALAIMGVASIAFSIAHDLRRGATRSRAVLGDSRAADLVVEAEASLGSRARALLAALAGRETYTEDHARRVALRAVQVGDEFGLSPGRRRDLAIGGLLHDIGKLAVPRSILQKPGPLTDAEYQVVMQHVFTGPALLGELGGFSPTVHRLVRGHHERFDGSGYPKAVAGDPIPLDVAILAVCDVYDALISQRVYRDAWSHERALEHLRAEAGDQFDATCVEALADVLARERRADLAVAV
jgi:HD-GYP domain-containing protein (c-di-GMP phosphodiesterase class II)